VVVLAPAGQVDRRVEVAIEVIYLDRLTRRERRMRCS